MKASLQQAVSLFAAPTSQMARLLAALEAQKQSEPQPVAEAPAAEPEAEAPAEEAEAPAAEAPDETPTAEAVAEQTDETDVAAESGGDSAASTSDEGE